MVDYSQLFSRYFFLSVNPAPNVAMKRINVKIIIGILPAPTLKLKSTKNITATIESIQNIPLDFGFPSPSPPFSYLLLIL